MHLMSTFIAQSETYQLLINSMCPARIQLCALGFVVDLYLYECKRGGGKCLTSVQTCKKFRICLQQSKHFCSRIISVTLRWKEGRLFDKHVDTKSTLDNHVFRYHIIGRRNGVLSFPSSSLILTKKKGGKSPGINSHVILWHDPHFA